MEVLLNVFVKMNFKVPICLIKSPKFTFVKSTPSLSMHILLIGSVKDGVKMSYRSREKDV